MNAAARSIREMATMRKASAVQSQIYYGKDICPNPLSDVFLNIVTG